MRPYKLPPEAFAKADKNRPRIRRLAHGPAGLKTGPYLAAAIS